MSEALLRKTILVGNSVLHIRLIHKIIERTVIKKNMKKTALDVKRKRRKCVDVER